VTLRAVLPELAHWFGLTPEMLEDMGRGEITEFTSRLRDLPPVGGSVGYTLKD